MNISIPSLSFSLSEWILLFNQEVNPDLGYWSFDYFWGMTSTLIEEDDYVEAFLLVLKFGSKVNNSKSHLISYVEAFLLVLKVD